LPDSIQKVIVEFHAGPAEHALLTQRSAAGVLDDENRRLYFDPNSNEQEDIDDTIDCINRVHALGMNIIHSFVVGFASKSAAKTITRYLDQQQCRYVLPFAKLDQARDGYHYGSATSEFFTDQIIQLI
jgi:hypothetical protein